MRTIPRPALLLAPLLLLASCEATRSQQPRAQDGPDLRARTIAERAVGSDIMVCGQRFATGAPVVLWKEPGGYDAYSELNHFPYTRKLTGPRYTPGREATMPDGSKRILVQPRLDDPNTLASVVDQFVVHYDVCGTSQTCFRVLHDERQLSVHFMIDVDGTIYQTMDVRDQAWHSAAANARSVGVELANIGAYPSGNTAKLAEWYDTDPLGAFVRPQKIEDRGVRTIGFVPRPARPQRVVGTIHGRTYEQYDFTPQQYDSLSKLAAALNRALPGLRLDAPRGSDGKVTTDALTSDQLEAYQGVLGHYHVTDNKQDPGPAFDWDKFLGAARGVQP